MVALALLAREVEEQHESESVEALRDAVKDLLHQLTVSLMGCTQFFRFVYKKQKFMMCTTQLEYY